MSNLQQQKKLVEQLRVECTVNRIPMSQSIKELIAFTEDSRESDPLVTGIDKKTNPFTEKNSCLIL